MSATEGSSAIPFDFPDRSLTELLQELGDSEDGTEQHIASNSTADGGNDVALLVARMDAASLQISADKKEKDSMAAHISLLESEIDDYKKTINTQKLEIKKISKINHELRRDLSRYRGMRRYTQGSVDNIGLSDTEGDINSVRDELNITKAKLNSLRDQVRGLMASMVSLLDDSPDQSSNPAEAAQQSASVMRERSPGRGQPIPVVVGNGKAPNSDIVVKNWDIPIGDVITRLRPVKSAHQPPQPPSYSDVTSRQSRGQPAVSDTFVIGSSLVRGLGNRLRQYGVDATTLAYPGATIPHIRSRLNHIFSTGAKPKEVVLQCGGNDLETQPVDKVAFQYDCLIKDIKKHCPQASVFINRVPPRRRHVPTLRKIDNLNSILVSKSDPQNKILCIDPCPSMPAYFQRDNVHFNKRGVDMFAKNLSKSLVNFSLCNVREDM